MLQLLPALRLLRYSDLKNALVTKVELHFDKIRTGKKHKNAFRHGVIYVDPESPGLLGGTPSCSSTAAVRTGA